MTFYGTTATGAGIVVPKKYASQVGDEGFPTHPIGAAPYKFVGHKPGVEIVLASRRAHARLDALIPAYEDNRLRRQQ